MSDDKTVVEDTQVDSVEDTSVQVDPKEYEDLKAEVIKLREHNEKVVADRKAQKEAATKKILAEKEKKALDNKDYKELVDLKAQEFKDRETEYQTKIAELDSKIIARDKADEQRAINDEAMKLALTLSKSSVKKAETLANILKNRLKTTEDGIKVIDEHGKLVSGDRESLLDFAKKEYDFLCDGIQSTGGAGVPKSTGVAQETVKLDPVARMNASRGF